MAAATQIDVQPIETAKQTPWTRVQSTIASLEGEVRTRLATFRKTFDDGIQAARSKGIEHLNTLKGLLDKNKALGGFTDTAEKLFEDGKKLGEETVEKLGLAKLADLQGLAKVADFDGLKDAFSGLQKKLDHLRQKVDKLADKAAQSPVSKQSTE